jgi:hypothetical protein
LNDLWKFDFNTNEWTWISGGNETDHKAVYEQQGVPHPDNVPGSRYGECMWEDDNGALWIYGGYGYSPSGLGGILNFLFTNYSKGYLNDVWKYENGMWTFVKGSVDINIAPAYGTPRVPDPYSHPGARSHCVCWKDNNGDFWLYGGYSVGGYRGDTWRFDGTNWAFWGGPENTYTLPVHGEAKKFSFIYHPGGRDYTSVAVTTSGSAAYIVGGTISGSSQVGDIWKFESDKGWAFWSGTTEDVSPNPGTIKVPSESNELGAKRLTMPVVDDFDNLWIFGGFGRMLSGYNGM